VGSQGDGTAQLLCRSDAARSQVAEILHREFGMTSIHLTLTSGTTVDTAVVPAAGFGQNNFPATLPVRMELFPLIDMDGIAKPIILINVEALVAAGIKNIIIIVQEVDLPSYQRLFNCELSKANMARLSPAALEYAKRIRKIGERVKFVVQERQEGFGHAVYMAKEHVGSAPFLLLLGDHVYSSSAGDGSSCVQQMLDT
jgi:UTP-glucose-1-phosphate uridylyltransferase